MEALDFSYVLVRSLMGTNGEECHPTNSVKHCRNRHWPQTHQNVPTRSNAFKNWPTLCHADV